MFYALTSSGKWLADIPVPSFIVTFMYAYKLQHLKVATPYTSKLKTSAEILNALLPSEAPTIKASSSAYDKIVYSSIKIGKAFKKVLLSKKTIAILSAISTASLLISGTALGGFPIILCATGAAFAAYRGEQRKEAIAQTTVGTISITNSYNQGKDHKAQGVSYPWPHPMEIRDKALTIAMTGITLGTSSIGFLLTVTKITCAVIVEIKDYSNVSSLKNQAEQLMPELDQPKPVELDKNPTQSQPKPPGPQGPTRS
jgi:hypothetical protein